MMKVTFLLLSCLVGSAAVASPAPHFDRTFNSYKDAFVYKVYLKSKGTAPETTKPVEIGAVDLAKMGYKGPGAREDKAKIHY